MVRRHTKKDDGMYHIGGHKYPILVGSRAQVWHRTAYKTTGGLKHEDLKQNEDGRIVSKVKSRLGKSQKHLGSHLQPKGSGHFGPLTSKKGKQSKKGGGKTMKRRKTRKPRKH
jgi:hypothetical protein